DGIADYLDLDSDNDSCSDANEYYNNTTSAASGQQFGQTGGAVAPVNANGTVNLPAATYTGSYANATSVGTSSSITSQPVNRLINAGTNTTFAVTATGGSGVTQYQWQVNSGSGFTNISNGGVYSNATTNTLTLTAVPSTFNGYIYRVIIRESNFVCSSVISSEGTLTVLPAPVVTIADA
ncbi:hypothetical protein DNC80_15825, partial [Flavobacterium sp. SOK18b]|nr:hypothetical protein [Flavobacterium sp. SOK18b]